MRVANAPCSWGVLEFGAAAPLPASQVLDEMAMAGYEGTELGDWGFLPTTPDALRSTIGSRALSMVAAFVPVALSREDAFEEGQARAVRTARLIAEAAASPAPLLVLSDDNATVPARTTRAGRIRDEDGLTGSEWDGFAARADRIALAVKNATGLHTVFHHHCAGYVETSREIDALMSRTSPATLGLCLDTGHLTFAGGDPLSIVERYGDRIWHLHLKDCDPEVAAAARANGWDYHQAVRHGVFCELGRGVVPFGAVFDALRTRGYDGWLVVEQDVLPGRGTPSESARRNRDYLRAIGV